MWRLLTLLLLLPCSAWAWTPAGDHRIAQKSADLAPPDLRLLIERFDAEYRAGLERARTDEGTEAHQYFTGSGQSSLRARIERETAATVAMIRKGEPMPLVVQRLGVIVHLVSDANNPFHVANDDPRLTLLHDDFERYFERRLLKFPTVFYGLAPQFTLSSYLDRTFTRTRRFYPLVSEEYFRFGEPRSSAEFDDRSTAFGVASICYSRAVTDVVNLYYHIWKEAGGDVRSARLMRSSNLLLAP